MFSIRRRTNTYLTAFPYLDDGPISGKDLQELFHADQGTNSPHTDTKSHALGRGDKQLHIGALFSLLKWSFSIWESQGQRLRSARRRTERVIQSDYGEKGLEKERSKIETRHFLKQLSPLISVLYAYDTLGT
jgi:hypothetical protein